MHPSLVLLRTTVLSHMRIRRVRALQISTASYGAQLIGSLIADYDDGQVAEDGYVGVDCGRPSLQDYSRSKSSALNVIRVRDYDWRIACRDGKDCWQF